MKAVIVTNVELNALLDRLELKKFQDGQFHSIPKEMREEAHRHFHYHIVRWIQEVGGDVKRS